MLEESRMDKKSLNRSIQPQSKATAVDCKKPENSSKPWPRNNKKREGNGNAPKNEVFRKNVPMQRGRGQVDRRGRSREYPNNMGGAQNARIGEEEEPEIGSVFVPGSKKQNLNHLLNFMYPTRGGSEKRDPYPPRRQLQHRMFLPHRHEHDLYLRAYCQFVVKEGEDFTFNLLDPDIPVMWEKIEGIIVRGTGKSECPICLGAPVAARVGHCGHVYCWACVLHYEATHDKQPPPCPVCATSLKVKEMKPAQMLQWKAPGEEVTMRLVRRSRDSTVVEVAPPRGELTQSTKMLSFEDIENSPYTKVFSATKKQICDILERERKELENQILAEIDTSEVVYLEEALKLLKLKEEAFDKHVEVKYIIEQIEKGSPKDACDAPVVYEKVETNAQRLDWFDVDEEGATCLDIVHEKLQNLNVEFESNLNVEAPEFHQLTENDAEAFPLIDYGTENEFTENVNLLTDVDEANKEKYFYFYQADDGQQVFLHSLNVRILKKSWESLVVAPPVIRGKVLHRETLNVVEQTRKHMPYTVHLPLHCCFDVVELDLQPPYVTQDAIEFYADELDRRARARTRQLREERRRERACRRAMEGPPKPDFSSQVVFPPAVASSPPYVETISPPEQPSASNVVMQSPTGLSFAKMASTSGTWRVRKAASPPPAARGGVDAEAEGEEGTAPRALSLSDAIEAALNATNASGKKKNKKSKPKLVFAMGMHHAN